MHLGSVVKGFRRPIYMSEDDDTAVQNLTNLKKTGNEYKFREGKAKINGANHYSGFY